MKRNSKKDNFVKVVTLSQTYDKKQDSGFHVHKLGQILFVEKGVFLFEDEYCRQILCADLAAYIPAKIKHRAVSIGEEVKFYSAYFQRNSKLIKPSGVTFFRSSNLLRELIKHISHHKGNRILQSKSISLLEELFESEITSTEFSNLKLPNSRDERILKLIQFIDDNYERKIQLSDFQNVLPLSTKQLDRIFRLDLKLSIMEYLRLKRIQMATILLRISNLSILEISFKCGFESLSSFYASFFDLAKTSPKKFRSKKIYQSNPSKELD